MMKSTLKLLFIPYIFLLSGYQVSHANQYEYAGDAIQWLLPVSALGLSYLEEDSDGRMQFFKSFGATAGVTYTVKLGVNRERPNGADYSFPSGHTSASFASATYIHQRYGYKKGRIAYLAAVFVGWSRIQADKHYTTDVLAGAALGTLTSYLFTTGKDVNLTTYGDREGVGINIRYKW